LHLIKYLWGREEGRLRETILLVCNFVFSAGFCWEGGVEWRSKQGKESMAHGWWAMWRHSGNSRRGRSVESGEHEKEGWRIFTVTIASADVAACANVRALGLPLSPPVTVAPSPTLWP
jgi:hypothetical protein